MVEWEKWDLLYPAQGEGDKSFQDVLWNVVLCWGWDDCSSCASHLVRENQKVNEYPLLYIAPSCNTFVRN